MQAEHIPVHLGSMPDAVAAIVDEEHREGDLWILNDPYRGGTHLPDITARSQPRSFASSGGLRELIGFAASRAHHADIGGPTPGGMPAALDAARRGGRGDPADPRRRRGAARPRRADAQPGPAPRRPARAAGRQPDRDHAGCASSADAARASSRCATGDGARSSTTPSAAPAPRSRRCPTARATAEDLLEAADGTDIGLRLRASVRGDALTLDFEGTDRADRGQPQLPALGDQGGLLLRGPGGLRSGRAALGRRLAAGRGAARPRAACSTRARRPRSRRATSRPRAGSPTW